MENYKYLRDFAMDVLKSSDEYFKKNKNIKILNSEGKDIKTDIDYKLNKYIFNKLKVTKIPIISEEGENKLNLIENICWVVDPIDGTFNLTKGFPFYCISIALWSNKKPVFGIIYDLNTKNIYYTNDENAFKNKEIIKASETKKIDESLISTGISSNYNLSSKNLSSLIISLQKFKKIRAIGSAAMSLCLVSEGIFDVYYEDDIFFWDVAAGIDLVKKSGGNVIYKFKENSFLMEVLCTNNNLINEAKKILLHE